MQGSTGSDHACNGRRIVLVYRENCDHNLYVIAEPIREQGTQRAINQSCGQDRFFTRASFSPPPPAWDFTHSIHTLFVVYE